MGQRKPAWIGWILRHRSRRWVQAAFADCPLRCWALLERVPREGRCRLTVLPTGRDPNRRQRQPAVAVRPGKGGHRGKPAVRCHIQLHRDGGEED
jgi:hypothetical protein